MFSQFLVLFIIVYIMSLSIRRSNTCLHPALYLLFAFMSRMYIYVHLTALTTFRICDRMWYILFWRVKMVVTTDLFVTIKQGCARLMSRESNLTRLWLKWVESESSRLWKSRIWVESESNHADHHLSQSWVNWDTAWVKVELSLSWVTWIVIWVRVESVRKKWVEHNPAIKFDTIKNAFQMISIQH